MNAVEILKKQHEELKDIMAKIETKYQSHEGIDEIDDLFQQFKGAFHLHDKLEDKVFYPELKEFPTTRALALKGAQAHHMVEIGLLELRVLPYSADSWLPKFLVIKDNLLQHMQEEETEAMTKAEAAIDASRLEDIGERMDKIIAKEKS